MADSFSKNKRSSIMRSVKSSGNKSTELKTISIFRQFAIKGWRRKYRIFGNPDFVFPSKKIALFVDGCFWHGHDCRNLTPHYNAGYWRTKISRNKERDKKVVKTLKSHGWRVIRIWECSIRKIISHLAISLK